MTFRKGNYVLKQCDGDPNWHYMIIRDDYIHSFVEAVVDFIASLSTTCGFFACDKKLTPAEANDAIDDFVKQMEGD